MTETVVYNKTLFSKVLSSLCQIPPIKSAHMHTAKVPRKHPHPLRGCIMFTSYSFVSIAQFPIAMQRKCMHRAQYAPLATLTTAN